MEENIKDKKKEKNSLKYLLIAVVGIIIIFVILFSIKKIFPKGASTIDDLHTANIEGKETKNNYVYNGFSFVKVGGMWYTQIQRRNKLYDVSIHFGPKEIGNIPMKGVIDDRFNKGAVYLTFDPTGANLSYVALATGELGLNLAKVVGRKVIGACTKNETYACSTRPIITCNNTDNAAIYIKQEDNAAIELNGNCIIISGRGKELIKSADKVILTWYGVMK